MTATSSLRVAYVVSRFPVLTQTFIVREMDALTRLGVDVELYSLVVDRPPVTSEASRSWLPRLHSQPWLSPGVVRANASFAARHPRDATGLARRVVAGHVRSPRNLGLALALGPKSVAFGADMRRRGVRHVHAHFGSHAALSAMVAARAAGIPFSFTVHAYDLFLDRTFLAEKIRAAAFVATISDFNRGVLSELAPDAADRIAVVRCGVPPETLGGRPPGSSPTTTGGPRILSVAALVPYKGLRHLIEAVSIVRTRVPDVSLVILGEGPERRSLERLRDRLGLRGIVHLPGGVPSEDVDVHLREADVFALPSVQEPGGNMDGIPVALMEAMAAGVPVIASRLGGIPELVRDDETGLLAAPADAGGLADAVERLWVMPELRERLVAEGRRWVLDEFGIDLNARRLLMQFERSSA